MENRLKEIRNKFELSQEKFGERLGVTKASISRLESGINNITESMIKLICSEFNVNEEWLRYGIGEMFIANTDSIISELEQKFEMGEAFKKAVSAYLKLNARERIVIDNYLNKILEEK